MYIYTAETTQVVAGDCNPLIRRASAFLFGRNARRILVDGGELLPEALQGQQPTSNALVIAEQQEIESCKNTHCDLEVGALEAEVVTTLAEHG